MDINGINFFNTPTACISHFDQKNWRAKTVSFVHHLGASLLLIIHKIYEIFHPINLNYEELGPNAKGKNRLIVCVHGHRSNPGEFAKINAELQTRDLSNTALLIPRVLDKGRAKIDDMVQLIFDQITAWGAQGKDKELVLVGISNGGRIIRALDAKLSTSPQTTAISRLHFISIVGACRGSDQANRINRLGLSCLLSPAISEEMPTGSKRNIRLDREWRRGLNTSRFGRQYTFIASPHDIPVPNYTSTLMQVPNQKARYAIIPGHGHCTIADAVAPAIATLCLSTK